jgi:hypothetical protein
MGSLYSAPEKIHDPKQESHPNADQNARNDRKIKSAMAPLVIDVAGQTAQPKGKPAAQGEERANNNQHNAKHKKQLADFAQRVHGTHCNATCSDDALTTRHFTAVDGLPTEIW